MGYIKPDAIAKVPIIGGELLLSPGYDVLHYFAPLGAVMLKYWNQEGSGMSNVLMTEESGHALAEQVGLMIVERPFIFVSEHESLVQWRADNLNDGDYGL